MTIIVGSYSSAEIQSVYSTAPADWDTGHSLGVVLPLNIDAFGVFYHQSPLGHSILIVVRVSYSSAEMQSVYATAPADREKCDYDNVNPALV